MNEHFIPHLLPFLGSFLSLLCLWGAYRAGRKSRLIDDLPTSKTSGVFIGMVELKGTAEATDPLMSHLAGKRCVLYDWSVEEHWSRTVTETYRDANGKTRTRTRRESGWTQVAQGGQSIPFYLKDDAGMVQVQPQKAKLHTAVLFDRTCGRSDPLYYGKGPARAIANSDHRRRFRETGIALHQELYVVGQAREREDIVAPEIAHDPGAPLFLISVRSEKQVSSGYRWAWRAWLMLALLPMLGAIALRQQMLNLDPALHWHHFVFGAGAFSFLAAGIWTLLVYNSLIELRQRVNRAWSLIDVELKRRHDLIPRLVSTVGGLRDHEKGVQEAIADLRAQLQATPPGESGPDFHSIRQDIRVLREAYPELKSVAAFAALTEAIVETEERIALARNYYNDITAFYNTRLERVPDRFVAALAGHKPRTLFVADDFERAPLKVELAP